MIKYLGSKRVLLPAILEAIAVAAPDATSVLDLFSGTSRVGHACKRAGYRVIANDHNAYAATLARCYVAADREEHLEEAERLIAELGHTPPKDGWFTETYARQSRYFQPKNAARIEGIRERIAQLALPPELEAIVLVSLMEAADRVDSTTGVQMAYLKSWAARASNDLALRVPDFLPRAKGGKGEAHQLDAREAARTLEADVAYVDPPYNQHSYLGNYHVWETLVRWDRPETFGVAMKRVDVRERQSPFNRAREAEATLAETIAAIRARALVVSFNDEGYVSRAAMESMLASRGHDVRVVEIDYKRYVGAKIGIFNPRGEKVGKVGRLRNTELLFVATPRDAS